MKKILIPGVALSLMFGSSVYANSAETSVSVNKQENFQPEKVTGLQNAIQKVKNENAREHLLRNLQKHMQTPEKPDVSLSTFMIGGIDVTKLEGFTSGDTVVLTVKDFSDFKGIVVKAADKDAAISVTVNGSIVQTQDLENLTFKANDIIAVTIKNGMTTQTYTVKLTQAADISLSTFTVGGIDASKLEGITSQDGAILKVENFNGFKGIVAKAADENAKVSVKLNGSILEAGNLANLLLRVNDVIVVTVDNGGETQAYKVTLQQK